MTQAFTAVTGKEIVATRIDNELVDSRGEKLPDASRKVPKPNDQFKVASYKLMISTYHGIFYCAGLPEDAGLDLFVASEIGSVIAAIAKMVSQSEAHNGFKSNHIEKTSNITFGGQTYSITNKDAYEIFKKFYDKFCKDFDKKDFFGCFQPLLYITLLFKDRYKSYRVAPTKKVKGKSATVKKEMELTQFGIMPRHTILLDGINLAPFIASSLCQSLGVGLVIFNVVQNGNVRFQARWKEALVKQIRHLPRYNEIVKFLAAGEGATTRQVIEELLDILLILLPRQTQRGSLPLNILSKAFTDKLPKYNKELKIPANEARSVTAMNLADELTFLEEKIKGFNNSGLAFGSIYNESTSTRWRIPGKISEEKAVSLAIMSIFGCGKEDLSVLKAMFNRNFHTRAAIGSELQKQSSSKEGTLITLDKLSYYSRLAQAGMSGMNLGQTSQQISSAVVFAGTRKRKIGEPLIEQITKKMAKTTQRVDGEGVLGILSGIRSQINARLEFSDEIVGGTTSWYRYSPIENAMDDGDLTKFWTEEKNFKPVEEGNYYFAN